MLNLKNEHELEVNPETTQPIPKIFDLLSLKVSKVEDKKLGKAKIIYANNGQFIGRYKNNKKNGRGELILPNNDKYVGKFYNDVFEGKGVYKWASGDLYEGDFKNGKMEGSACITFTNGDVYEGGIKNGKKEGPGVYIFQKRWIQFIMVCLQMISMKDQEFGKIKI